MRNLYKVVSLSFVSRLSLWYWSRRFDRTLQVFIRRQAIVSIYCVGLFVQPWLLVIGVSRTSLMVGGFRCTALLVLSEEENVLSVVRCGSNRLLCCLIVGIHASEISVPLSPLMLLGWSLMWIASKTLREYQWGSRSMNLTSSQSGYYADLVTERERHLTTGKRAERTKLDFRYPIFRSAIGQASCLIWARNRQQTFPVC